MDFQLNETEQLLSDSLARFVRDAAGTPDAAAQSAQIRAMGWHGASVPEDHGGFGLGMVGAMLVAEHLAAALSPLCWQGAAVLPAVALTALAEAGDAAPLADFLASGPVAQPFMLAAGDAVRPTRDGGGALVPTPALRSALQGAARITAAAGCLGAMQQLFDMTLDYTKTRQQFGRPLSSFQALQHRLVDMFIALDESRSLVMAAAMAADAGRADAPHMARAAWDKARGAAQHVAEEAIQLHGGVGMTEEWRGSGYVRLILRAQPVI